MSESEGDMPHVVGCEFRCCETCRYWGHEDGSEKGEKFRTCRKIPHGNSDDQESVIESPAFTIDGSGYYAALRTNGDFCCSLWEA